MELNQKILQAKADRRKRFIKLGVALSAISLLCAMLVVFAFPHLFSNGNAEIVLAVPSKGLDVESASSPAVSNQQLRQGYIDALTEYQNSLKPELDKVDLNQWNKALSEGLALLKDKALAEFTAGNYVDAKNSIEELNQLAETAISDSQQQFGQALSNAQREYDTDHYNEAKHQIDRARMLDKTSVEASALAAKIEKLPEILRQLKKIDIAKVENNLNKELSLIKELLKIAPDRIAIINRKKELIGIISHRNFKTYLSQFHKALKQGDVQTAKQKISLAKKIFPNRQEIADATQALHKFEKKHRFEIHQQKAEMAIKADDWSTAKKQLELALQEQTDNAEIKKSLAMAATVVSLNSEFERQIKSPYHLANKQLISRLKKNIAQASQLSGFSSSLNKNATDLSHLINAMNTKISVEVVSDKQTDILVRGIGKVGKTQSKTIQLLPGRYTFEGKRKGFKSKLLDVLIPYDKPRYRVNIRCDEPI